MMYIDNEVLEKMIMTIVEGFDRIEKKLDRMGRVKEFLNGDELLDNYDIARLLNVSLRTVARYREKGLIRQKMELMGVRNMQAYLRKMAIDGYAVKLDLPELREAVAMLGRYNGNINQIAKRANETGRVYDTDIQEIRASQKEIWKKIDELLTRLGALGL